MSQPSGTITTTCRYCGEFYTRTNWMKRKNLGCDNQGNLLGDTHQAACWKKVKAATDAELTSTPRCFLMVRYTKSGEEWIKPLRSNSLLDLTYQVRKWVKEHFASELRLDGEVMPKVEGDFYAELVFDIIPEEERCWEGGGFFLKES